MNLQNPGARVVRLFYNLDLSPIILATSEKVWIWTRTIWSCSSGVAGASPLETDVIGFDACGISERVAVRGGLGEDIRADHACPTRAVFHHHPLSPTLP